MREHHMQGLCIYRDMSARVYVRCPDDDSWGKVCFEVKPIDLETHVVGFQCPTCEGGLIWDGRQIHADLMALAEWMEEDEG